MGEIGAIARKNETSVSQYGQGPQPVVVWAPSCDQKKGSKVEVEVAGVVGAGPWSSYRE